jgi:hypothetical protein
MARFSVGDEVRTAGGDRVLVVRKLTGSGGYKLRDSVTGKKVAFEWYDEELEPVVREEAAWERAKPGDWVRVEGDPDVPDGHYRVIDAADSFVIRLLISGPDRPIHVYNSCVKAIVLPPATAPKLTPFSVGDRVEYARRDTHGFSYLPAIHYRDTGTVVAMGEITATVRLDRNGFRVTTAASDWKPEDASEAPPRTFKPGDWVRDAHDGQVGVVFHDSGEPEDESPYRVGHPDSGEYFDYCAADLLPN